MMEVSRVQVQAVNRRAQQKYGEFVGAIDHVTEMFGPCEKLCNQMKQGRAAAGGWRMASPDELKRLLVKARRDLETLKDHAKRYEAELISRDWRI
jgi:hypothetical protein